MTFVELLYQVILVLVYGFVVITAAYVIIGKICDERRKIAENSGKELDKLMKQLPYTIADAYKLVINITKKEIEDRKKEQKNYGRTSYSDMYGEKTDE